MIFFWVTRFLFVINFLFLISCLAPRTRPDISDNEPNISDNEPDISDNTMINLTLSDFIEIIEAEKGSFTINSLSSNEMLVSLTNNTHRVKVTIKRDIKSLLFETDDFPPLTFGLFDITNIDFDSNALNKIKGGQDIFVYRRPDNLMSMSLDNITEFTIIKAKIRVFLSDDGELTDKTFPVNRSFGLL